MPDINDLNLTAEEMPEIDLGDQNAPETGTFLPRLKPGTVYRFKFKLADIKEDNDPAKTAPFALVERTWPPDSGQKAKFLQVSWNAIIDPAVQPEKFPEGTVTPIELRFNRANAYKHPKMKISELGDLLRCLGVNIADPSLKTMGGLKAKLMELDGQGATGEFEAGWNCYFEDSTQTFTTGRPEKAYTGSDGIERPGSQPWPRNGGGAYQEYVEHDGVRKYARDFVQGLKIPKTT